MFIGCVDASAGRARCTGGIRTHEGHAIWFTARSRCPLAYRAVEAAGIEPASQIATGEASPCSADISVSSTTRSRRRSDDLSRESSRPLRSREVARWASRPYDGESGIDGVHLVTGVHAARANSFCFTSELADMGWSNSFRRSRPWLHMLPHQFSDLIEAKSPP